MEVSSSLFQFKLAGIDENLSFKDKLWDRLLYSKDSNLPVATACFSIGDYFLSAKKFLKENKYKTLLDGLSSTLQRNIKTIEITRILISLEKHGPFYHPIKVMVSTQNDESALFVLNGAVSDMGLAIIENEYQNLIELKGTMFVPKVFGMGFVESEKGRTGFFLAQWFDKFEEFHGVKIDGEGKTRLGILNSNGTFSILSDLEAFEIYKRISEILTLYYDLKSFKQIFPWHHAAGDFVVRIEQGKIDVKLITVRGYGVLMEPDDKNKLLGLLFFFLNLSLRMRIDRNKGTQEYIFLDKIVVKATIEGFLKGLETNLAKNFNTDQNDPGFFNVFMDFLKELDLANLFNLFTMISGSYNSEAPETEILEKNLYNHAEEVFKIVKKF